MESRYDHAKYEQDIYAKWERSGAFKPKGNGKPFSIIMPPPNSNDPLHIGHARFVTISDILIRYHRMLGDNTLWLPGADHAGIETQFVYEKKLKKEGKSRADFDRETLYKNIWDYVQENRKTMEGQLRRLGASADWSRDKFTLDEDIVEIVKKTFRKLYDEGLVYRGEKIVNYSPSSGTFFSELEVEYEEQEGTMYYIDYGAVTIATTRPETIFADVAVAVNPNDKRHKALIGKTATVPIVNREVPIIGDELVEREMGTGALKVTPGHDAVDFEIGQKHDLETISVIDEKGKLINVPEVYEGIFAGKARKLVADDLEKEGLLVKTKRITHSVAVDYKTKGPIEPMISEQWFMRVEGLAKRALDAIDSGAVKFVDKSGHKKAVHWLTNLKDWNISRQIVWGIRIPAWEKGGEWSATETSGAKQDTDTFDTWFSSGQWPFATLMTTGDFDTFYPTSVMVTGHDILFAWVIRMIMLGLYETGKVPFADVVLYGLVRDRDGLKISKSKGNVIDPIEMADKYGTDALRMSLVWGAKIQSDVSLSEDNIRAQRNFSNKLWNIARFIQMDLEPNSKLDTAKPKGENDHDKAILKRLGEITKSTGKLIEAYRLNEAAESIYEFVWHEFADRYIEQAKDRKQEAMPVLAHVLRTSLKLLHPFMPFVTEAVWEELGNESMLITSEFPS